MKYEYLLHTWGGFYNEGNQKIHGELSGDHYFDIEKERETYLIKLKDIAKEIGTYDCRLMNHKEEGFTVRTPPMLHRISEYKGEQVHTTRDGRVLTKYDDCEYMLEYKWYPGFNDYPFGEDFDYEQEDFKIVQEWITGSFVYEEEGRR
jgi:hypothetical protein